MGRPDQGDRRAWAASALRDLPARNAVAIAALLGAVPFAVVELFRSRLYFVASVPAHLVFHNIAEFFSIMVSLSVFGVGWFSHEQSRDRHALFLACAFLGVGLMDFMHAMSFPGMPAFFTANVATKTSQYWIAVRLFDSAALLASAFVLPGASARWLSRGPLLLASLAVSAVVFTAVNFYPQHLPLTYDPAVGLTRFKVLSEYVVISLLLAAILGYLHRARRTGEPLASYYVAAFVLLAYSELVFTVYRSMFDTFNVVGHVYKVAAFYLVYRAVFIASVQRPYLALEAGRRELEEECREREAAEEVSGRLNRELRAIRNCNQVLVRADDEPTLLNHVCRIVCDEAGYRMAWVGFAEHDQARVVRPVAWAGAEEGYLEAAGITWADTERGRGPAGAAIRGGTSVCIQDFTSDPLAAPWREAALRRGYRSSIALPLRDEEAKTFGVLCIYSARPDAFTVGEIRLLEGLADDLAFGITVQRARVERRRAEEQIHAASLYARNLIEASLDPLVTISPQGKITDVNRATEEVTGVPRSLIVGTDFADYFTEPERARAGYGQVLAAGKVHDYPLTIRHVDGRTTEVLYNATLYRGPDGELQGVLAAARDITEQRRLEDQLRQSQKLEGIGRLAGGVAHDFNNVLTAITTASQFLLEELPPGATARQDAADILEAARMASALTRQLLIFSRRQVVQPMVVDLNEVVVGMERMLRRLIGEDIELVELAGPDLGHVRVDPGQMEQVIVNLAVNARDAMPGGGTLTIRTANVEVGGEAPGLSDGLSPVRYAMLAVQDTGHGMGPEVLSHLFEPFFTTKAPGKGTGLGLSTVYGIVKQAEGTLRVRSEPGKGSAFEIYLPRVDAPVETSVPEAGPPARGTETVLLVEDEGMVRRLTARALRDAGYQVLEAADGEEAWRLIEGYTGKLDLVVTDVVMPRMGGKELGDRLRKERPGIGILFVSGYTDHAADLTGLVADGRQFLQKPFAPRTLALRVRDLLDRRGVEPAR